MFDFSALKESQAAIHAVRHGCIEQGCFNHATLCIAAVEHGNFMAIRHTLHAIAVLPLAQKLFHFFHHPLRFGKVGGRLINTHRFTGALRGV